MGPLTPTGSGCRPGGPGPAATGALLCGLLLGLAAASALVLLRDGRRRTHLRRARQLLAEPARGAQPPAPGWP